MVGTKVLFRQNTRNNRLVKTNSHKVRRMANQCERSTANSVALGIIALLGRSGMDWLYLEQMQDKEWWQLQGWIKRN